MSKNVDAKMLENRRRNVCKNMLKVFRKSSKIMENRSKIVIKSIKMGLGTVLAPGTEHATPRLFQECSPEEIPGAFGHCFRENVAPRVVFGTPRDPKMGPKSHF